MAMGVFDNLVNRLKGGYDGEDDYEDDDMIDDYEDDDVDDRRRAPRGPIPFKRNNDEEDDYEERRPSAMNNRNANPSRQGTAAMPVAQQRRRTPAVGGAGMQVRIIKPSAFDQASQITDTLLSQRTVLLNIEGLDVNTAQRIVDFAYGSCYALSGNFMKISNFIIVITPKDVDITGDVNAEGGGLFGAMAAASAAGAASAAAQPAQQQSNPYNTGFMNNQFGGAPQF